MNIENFKMDLIEICALKRSGHHAFMGWLVKNLYGLQPDFGFKLEFVSDSGLWIWNDTTNYEKHGTELFYSALEHDYPKTLMVNYEDEPVEYSKFHNSKKYMGPKNFNFDKNINIHNTHRFYYVRDFYNCLSSRIKHNNNMVHTFDFGENYVNMWKQYAYEILKSPKQSIKYEDLVLNTSKCDEFLFDNFGVHQRYSVNDVKGRNSSFGDNKNYLNRFDINLLPQKTKDLIRKDNELHYLIGALGYEYKEI